MLNEEQTKHVVDTFFSDTRDITWWDSKLCDDEDKDGIIELEKHYQNSLSSNNYKEFLDKYFQQICDFYFNDNFKTISQIDRYNEFGVRVSKIGGRYFSACNCDESASSDFVESEGISEMEKIKVVKINYVYKQ